MADPNRRLKGVKSPQHPPKRDDKGNNPGNFTRYKPAQSSGKARLLQKRLVDEFGWSEEEASKLSWLEGHHITQLDDWYAYTKGMSPDQQKAALEAARKGGLLPGDHVLNRIDILQSLHQSGVHREAREKGLERTQTQSRWFEELSAQARALPENLARFISDSRQTRRMAMDAYQRGREITTPGAFTTAILNPSDKNLVAKLGSQKQQLMRMTLDGGFQPVDFLKEQFLQMLPEQIRPVADIVTSNPVERAVKTATGIADLTFRNRLVQERYAQAEPGLPALQAAGSGIVEAGADLLDKAQNEVEYFGNRLMDYARKKRWGLNGSD